MADRLTQLQDAVDQVYFEPYSETNKSQVLIRKQLAHQFVASVYYVNKHHDLKPVSANDKIREGPNDQDGSVSLSSSFLPIPSHFRW